MAALAIGLGGAVGELWVQDGLLLLWRWHYVECQATAFIRKIMGKAG